jgi:hypothetical protein
MREQFRASFQSLSNSVKPIRGLMAGVRAQAAAALRDNDVRAQHSALHCASVVVMSGYLESFMREAAEAFFAELKNANRGLGTLDDKFVHVHYTQGARILTNLVSGEKIGSKFSEAAVMLQRLSAPISDADAPPLWEAFARTDANPSAAVIKAYLAGFGINDGLSVVSEAINQTYSPAALETTLLAFIAVRNECAHTGSAKSVPSTSDIEGYVTFLRTLALGVTKALNQRLSAILAP